MKYFLFFIFLLPTLVLADNQVLTYGPSTVELTGTLDLQTFPGPPNYESINDGDEVERHFYLKLSAPIDVLFGGVHSGVENAAEERNVRTIQLAIDAEDEDLWARFRKIGEGGSVKIRGTLFHRFTGHHHSRVLFSVNDLEPLGKVR